MSSFFTLFSLCSTFVVSISNSFNHEINPNSCLLITIIIIIKQGYNKSKYGSELQPAGMAEITMQKQHCRLTENEHPDGQTVRFVCKAIGF